MDLRFIGVRLQGSGSRCPVYVGRLGEHDSVINLGPTLFTLWEGLSAQRMWVAFRKDPCRKMILMFAHQKHIDSESYFQVD